MEITICTDKNQWDKLLSPLNQAEFLQSWEWGMFQENTGKSVLRLVVGEIPVQGVVHAMPLGLSFVYFPRIPLLSIEQQKVLAQFLKKKAYVFARFEPAAGSIDGDIVPCRQPKTTVVLNLRLSEEEILAGMHAKTRYNIRLASKKGVTVTREKNADIFWQLNTDTTERDKFKSHGREYYEHMLASPIVEQFIAWHGGMPIATIICVVLHDTVVYLHGASANAKRNIMAPYLLQWEAIQYAKAHGAISYDFWGVAPQGTSAGGPATQFNGFTWQANHPWTGVTRFKVGFGGSVVSYPDAVEVPLKKLVYTAINLLKKFR